MASLRLIINTVKYDLKYVDILEIRTTDERRLISAEVLFVMRAARYTLLDRRRN
jgi:hypothetical protein